MRAAEKQNFLLRPPLFLFLSAFAAGAAFIQKPSFRSCSNSSCQLLAHKLFWKKTCSFPQLPLTICGARQPTFYTGLELSCESSGGLNLWLHEYVFPLRRGRKKCACETRPAYQKRGCIKIGPFLFVPRAARVLMWCCCAEQRAAKLDHYSRISTKTVPPPLLAC